MLSLAIGRRKKWCAFDIGELERVSDSSLENLFAEKGDPLDQKRQIRLEPCYAIDRVCLSELPCLQCSTVRATPSLDKSSNSLCAALSLPLCNH